MDLETVGPEDQPRLGLVGDEVGLDLLGRQPGPGGRPAGGVAHLGREIAQDQHGGVPQVLELAELPEHDGEAEMDVGGRGIDPQLHPEGLVTAQFLAQVGFGDEVDGAGPHDPDGFVDRYPFGHGRTP